MCCLHADAKTARYNTSIPFLLQSNRQWTKRYLDTCPKNDVISFSRKRFCAVGRVRLGLYDLGQTSIYGFGQTVLAEIRFRSNGFSGNTVSVKRF